jgi:hypothetical protein
MNLIKETIPLTTGKIEEYMGLLIRGEIDVDELKAGLKAIHGTTQIEGTMTPREFIDYLGIPLDQIEMSDELRKELRMEYEKIEKSRKL